MTPPGSNVNVFAARIEAEQLAKAERLMKRLVRYRMDRPERQIAYAITLEVVQGRYRPPTDWPGLQDWMAELASRHGTNSTKAFQTLIALDMAGIIPRLADSMLTATDDQVAGSVSGKAVQHG